MTDFLQPTLDLAHALLEHERESPPDPPLSPERIRELIELGPPEQGLGLERALGLVGEVVEMTPMTSGRRFFNQLFAGREPAAASTEMLTSLLNTSMYTYKVAGVHALIENEVLARMGRLAGFEDADGTFVPGGSLGNLVGLTLAVNERRPDFRDHGHDGRRLLVYTSAEGHYSVRKSAGMMGLGRDNVRRVATDEEGRMCPLDLDRRIVEDLEAGHEPACVVATAGTTVRGAFDPIDELADVTTRHDLWLHVDGAFGGSLLLHPEHRRRLAGLERADSFIWDAHKMMGIPMPCSALLVARRGLLHKHFQEAADYLYQQDSEDLNLGLKSIQCGRRNDAFKLWAAWQALGDEGWARRIDRQFELVNHARARVLKEPNLELVDEPQAINLCFAVDGCRADVLCERLSASGESLVGYGVVHGRKIIRLVTANPDLDESDVDRFFDGLLAEAARLRIEAERVESQRDEAQSRGPVTVEAASR